MSNVSVALSGSGFRFPTHVGALQAILDAGFTVSELAGTSGGSIVAGMAAIGTTPASMLQMAHNTPFQSFINFDLINLIHNQAINSGMELLKWLSTYLGITTFNDTLVPLHVISTDLNTYKSYIFSKSTTPLFSVAQACRASASIPLVFSPMILGDKFLVDGGVSNDLPVNCLDPLAMKFAISLIEAETQLTNHSSITAILGRVLDTFMTATESAYNIAVKNCVFVDVVTPPNMTLDTNMTSAQIDNLYQLGYDATKKAIASM